MVGCQKSCSGIYICAPSWAVGSKSGGHKFQVLVIKCNVCVWWCKIGEWARRGKNENENWKYFQVLLKNNGDFEN